MKIIIPEYIEKQLEKYGISIDDFLRFFKKTPFTSLKFKELCAPLDDTKIYKIYLDQTKRVIIFYVHKKGLLYPVYVGDKNDEIAKNITVQIIRSKFEFWQDKVLANIRNKKYKIRHY